MERFLERISLSAYRDKFVLKGGIPMPILVNKIHCKKCGEEIESTYPHDFR